jgi:hypothetical protein
MNVLDPLQALNNLGRSVSRASHMRIVAAMKHASGSMQQMLRSVVRPFSLFFGASSFVP